MADEPQAAPAGVTLPPEAAAQLIELLKGAAPRHGEVLPPVQAKMSGPEVIGRLVAIEGLILALAEERAKQPDGKAFVETFDDRAKALSTALGHKEAQYHAAQYIDEMVAKLGEGAA